MFRRVIEQILTSLESPVKLGHAPRRDNLDLRMQSVSAQFETNLCKNGDREDGEGMLIVFECEIKTKTPVTPGHNCLQQQSVHFEGVAFSTNPLLQVLGYDVFGHKFISAEVKTKNHFIRGPQASGYLSRGQERSEDL